MTMYGVIYNDCYVTDIEPTEIFETREEAEKAAQEWTDTGIDVWYTVEEIEC